MPVTLNFELIFETERYDDSENYFWIFSQFRLNFVGNKKLCLSKFLDYNVSQDVLIAVLNSYIDILLPYFDNITRK